MSRMLALRSPRPARMPEALLEAFLALARIHSDGWGCTTANADGRLCTATGMSQAVEGLREVASRPQTAALHYLRLASADSRVAPENLQPFRDGDMSFMHNGALVPRARGLEALTASEYRELRGTSDSEVYFALLRRSLISDSRDSVRDRVSHGVAATRELYPAACLNAMMLVEDALVVIASRGTVSAPLEALAARGSTLGPEEADAYNRLFRTRTDDGACIVATSGIDVTGWDEIPDGEILVI